MQNSLVIQLRTVKIDFNTTDVCLSTVITRKSTVMTAADSYNERTDSYTASDSYKKRIDSYNERNRQSEAIY